MCAAAQTHGLCDGNHNELPGNVIQENKGVAAQDAVQPGAVQSKPEGQAEGDQKLPQGQGQEQEEAQKDAAARDAVQPEAVQSKPEGQAEGDEEGAVGHQTQKDEDEKTASASGSPRGSEDLGSDDTEDDVESEEDHGQDEPFPLVVASRDAVYDGHVHIFEIVYNIMAVWGLSGWNRAMFPVHGKITTTLLIPCPLAWLLWGEKIPYILEEKKQVAAVCAAMQVDMKAELKKHLDDETATATDTDIDPPVSRKKRRT